MHAQVTSNNAWAWCRKTTCWLNCGTLMHTIFCTQMCTHMHVRTHTHYPALPWIPSGTACRPKCSGILCLLPNKQHRAESGAHHKCNGRTWAVRGPQWRLEGEDDRQHRPVGQVPHSGLPPSQFPHYANIWPLISFSELPKTLTCSGVLHTYITHTRAYADMASQ